MLPYPFEKYIPKIFTRTADLLALAAKVDKWLVQWKKDVLGFETFADPVRAPAVILDETGYHLAAGIKGFDDDDTKRKKIANAISTHRKLGRWTVDIKIRIDAITGLNTLLYSNEGGDQFIFCDGGATPPQSAFYWAALGVDGLDNNLGPVLDDGTLFGNPGHVYIDFTAAIPSGQLDDVKAIFEDDFIPAYLVIHLGYASGINFIEQAVI